MKTKLQNFKSAINNWANEMNRQLSKEETQVWGYSLAAQA